MTGIIELAQGFPAGRVRLNIKRQDGRVVGFRPNPAERPLAQSTEDFEYQWYAYWQKQVGQTITFDTNRYGAPVAARVVTPTGQSG